MGTMAPARIDAGVIMLEKREEADDENCSKGIEFIWVGDADGAYWMVGFWWRASDLFVGSWSPTRLLAVFTFGSLLVFGAKPRVAVEEERTRSATKYERCIMLGERRLTTCCSDLRVCDHTR